MKSPLMSAKEATKTKFEQLVKAALEDAKLNTESSLKTVKPHRTVVKDVADASSNQLLSSKAMGFHSSTSDILQLTVPIKKNRKKGNKDGLLNSAFEDGASFVKDVDDNERKTKESGGEPSAIPQKPKRKHKNLLEKKNQTTNSFEETAGGQNTPSFEMFTIRSEIIGSEGDLQSASTSLGGEPNDAGVQRAVQAEVHGSPFQPSKPRMDLISTTLDNNLMTTSKGYRRERRRRQKEMEAAGSSGSSVQDSPKSMRKTFYATAEVESHVTEDQIMDPLEMENVFGIIVHRTDRLKMNFKIKHPVVQVHIIDSSTGTYLKKSRKDKIVTAVYENRNVNVDYVMQVMTQPCDLKLRRLIFPIWEETIVYNELFHHFTKQDSNVVVFFEILDFLPMSFVRKRPSNAGQSVSWYRIAWAFLKVVGANGALNSGRKLQLQLYCVPKQRIRPEPRILDLYHWWSQLPKIRYPATLYVTLASLSPPKALPAALRSMATTQEERSINQETMDEAGGLINASTVLQGSMQMTIGNSAVALQWSRFQGQACKVPDKQILTLRTTKRGCFVVKFSTNGRWIACGCQNENTSDILVYDVLSGSLRSTLKGHTGLIYDLHWTKSDEILLSASADGTARTWCPLSNKCNEAQQLMPHPSFVYCANFHPQFELNVVTGCYDSLIRVWTLRKSDNNCHLIQELEGHRGHVNALCFNLNGVKLLSGDSAGVVCVWNVPKHLRNEGDADGWTLSYEIKNQESKTKIAISALVHHPNLKRVLVQSCDGSIRMLDYEKKHFIQNYKGCLNLREHLSGCVSPCGSLIFAGGEDGCVHVWNSITGDSVSRYNNLPHQQTVRCVTYHPHDHVVAFCYHGKNTPVLVYKYIIQDHVQPSRVITSTPLKTNKLDANNRLVSFMDSTTTSTASTCVQKIMSKLDSILKMPTNVSRPQSDKIGGLELTKTFNSSVSSWDTTFDTVLSANEQDLWVIAQHNYLAQRSDEVSFKTGERIKVLRKESDKWWVGQLDDGRHGYIPANYVLIALENVPEMKSKHQPDYDVAAVMTKPSQLMFASDSDSEDEEIEE